MNKYEADVNKYFIHSVVNMLMPSKHMTYKIKWFSIVVWHNTSMVELNPISKLEIFYTHTGTQ